MKGRSFAVVFFVVLSACSGKPEQVPSPPAPVVRTMMVQPIDEAPIEVRGTVQAASRLRLGFKLPGVVSAVLVKEGDLVRKGQVLARLDQTDARSQVRMASANRTRAAQDFTRADRLMKAGALPSKARDDARNALEAADAALAVAIENLKRTQLTAPVAGKVVQRISEPGETVGAGVPVLTVDDAENLVVKVGVTDRDLRRLSLGQAATLQAEDGSAAQKGAISSLAPSPNSGDGLYTVEIRPQDQRLLPGSLMAVRFEETKSAPVLRIPTEATVRRQDKDWVFVVEGGGDQAVARMRSLALGRAEGRDVAVRSGLQGGERIITEGTYFLQDGQPVRVLD